MSVYGDAVYGDAPYAGEGSGSEDGGWTTIGGAIVDTVAEGPAYYTDEDGNPVTEPGVFVTPFSIAVYDPDDLTVALSTLEETFSRSFLDEANDTGSGTFAFENTDDDAVANAQLDYWVNFYVYGNLAFTMIVEAMHRVSLAQGEEHDQITVVTGRGHIADWENWVMYPSRGPDSLPIEDDRVFDWTSMSYVHTAWAGAKSIIRQDQDSYPWGGDPVEWPDPTAWWIWDSSGTVQWARPGTCYFRWFFTTPPNVSRIITYFAADNRCKIYFDGIPIAEQGHEGPEFSTKSVETDVTEGLHLIAAEATNDPIPGASGSPTPASPVTYTVVQYDTLWKIAQEFYGSGQQWRQIYNANQAQIQADAEAAGLWDPNDPGHWIFPGQVFTIPGINPSTGVYNPGGFICAVYTYSAAGPTDLLAHTNSLWRVVGYSAEPPGMTPGQVIRIAKKEAFNRGNAGANEWTLKFTDAVDSAGQPWPIVSDIATKVGTSYLTFLQELTVNYIDLWAKPGTKELYAWNKGTRGKVRPVNLHAPTDPSDPLSGNLYELAHTVIT